MEKKYILALTQETTSSRSILFNNAGEVVCAAEKELNQIYPSPGWVEYDPMEIWGSQIGVSREVIEKAGVKPEEIAAIGIANQRETVLIWNKNTGKPIYNAIGWQCRRSTKTCDELKEKRLQNYIRNNTGLVIDPCFSATKIKWILDNVEGARELAEKGDLLFGTIDTWLIWNLTKGGVHITDYSNASRTMIYNIKELRWDEKLLKELGIPDNILPAVRNSSEVYAYTDEKDFGARIPIAGIAGNQQAALFGQACLKPGMAKNTYEKGCFMLMNTGNKIVESKKGLLTTVAWGINDRIEYALEGSIFFAGDAIEWLRDELRIVRITEESEVFATSVKDSNGVYVVPAFTGIGAPYWDMYARGIIVGLTPGARAEHIVRATLEAIAYGTKDILEAMEYDLGIKIQKLRVDGDVAISDFLMQFQSDILNVDVERPEITEPAALGVAYLAGLAVEFWENKNDIRDIWKAEKVFESFMEEEQREKLYAGWKKAVQRSLRWESE